MSIDITHIESIVHEAWSGNGESKTQATRIIDELRSNVNNWRIGLALFFNSTNESARFFGLTLIREFLIHCSRVNHIAERKVIIESFTTWLNQDGSLKNNLPTFILNSLANILTMCVKNDFPDNWPQAFEFLLNIGHRDTCGLDILVRVISDFDEEVVMYKESRTEDEIRHNTLIKDIMRTGSIVKDIVALLSSSYVTVLNANNNSNSNNSDLSERILLALAELIGWVDISLIINPVTLSNLYAALDSEAVCGAACTCLFEVAKKGMDPVDKIKMIDSIGLVNIFTRIPIETMVQREMLEEVAKLLDVVELELLGCWGKFEGIAVDVLLTSINQYGPNNIPNFSLIDLVRGDNDLANILPTVGNHLSVVTPLLLKIFASSPNSSVSTDVIPSIKKLLTTMKLQSQQTDCVNLFKQLFSWYVDTSVYLPMLLQGIYIQSQLSDAYTSAEQLEDDEEMSEDIEAKKEIRKLFVSCCRVNPEVCLQLIGAVLARFQMPLSTAPFSPLEAVLRLIYVYSEMGTPPNNNSNQADFSAIIRGLHASEIENHSSPLVLIAFFEITARYAKMVPLEYVYNVLVAMTREKGLRNIDSQLRARSAYLFLKIIESVGSDSVNFLPLVPSLSDLILTPPDRPSPISDQSELYLLEGIGLVTSAEPPSNLADRKEMQVNILNEMMTALTQQLQMILQHPQFDRYADQLTPIVARKLGSLSSLSRGHSYKSRPDTNPIFQNSIDTSCHILVALSKYKIVRSKGIVLLHRMINCLGPALIDYVGRCYPSLMQYSDVNDVEFPIQLLNQLMVEFHSAALNVIDNTFNTTLDHLSRVYNETVISSTIEVDGQATTSLPANLQEALEMERLRIQKIYMIFIQHVLVHNCQSALLSEKNQHRLQEIFNSILMALQQGDRSQNSQNLRRNAITLLVQMTKVWVPSTTTVSSPPSTPSSTTSTSPSPAEVPESITSLLIHVLCEQIFPVLFRMCLDDGTSNDAQSQAILTDAGLLVWTLSSVRKGETLQYFHNMLPVIGWSPETVVQMLQLVDSSSASTAGTFKDNFKKMIRKWKESGQLSVSR